MNNWILPKNVLKKKKKKEEDYPGTTTDPLREITNLVQYLPNIRDHILPITVYNCVFWSTESYMKDRPILCAVYLKVS